MEYIYACLLLFRAKKEINEASIKKVLESAGVKVDEGRIKGLVAALDGIDIEKAIKEAAIAPVAAVAHVAEAKKEEKKEEKKPAEDAVAGLGSLFG